MSLDRHQGETRVKAILKLVKMRSITLTLKPLTKLREIHPDWYDENQALVRGGNISREVPRDDDELPNYADHRIERW